MRTIFGSPAHQLRGALIRKVAGKDILVSHAIVGIIDDVRADLEGPNPTPIERLLAERVALCWFIVYMYEHECVDDGAWSVSQMELQQRKIDKAHARFLSAVRSWAQMRKLALPALQLLPPASLGRKSPASTCSTAKASLRSCARSVLPSAFGVRVGTGRRRRTPNTGGQNTSATGARRNVAR
jgi:hypothetical protein